MCGAAKKVMGMLILNQMMRLRRPTRRKHMAMHMHGDLDQEHMWLDDRMGLQREHSQIQS